MSHLHDHILGYADLSTEERQHLEAVVAEHPDLVPLLEETKALEALFQHARTFSADPPGEDALAYYVATHCVDNPKVSPTLEAVFRRVEMRLEEDTDYRIQYNHFQQRMELLEAQSDPVAQFEQLAGYPLNAAPAVDSRALLPDKSAARPPVPRSEKWVKWGATGLIACAALYGMLFITSEASRSDLDRLAAVEAASLPEGIQLRGSETNAADAHYLEAVALLHDAQVATFGLFPRFDSEQVDESSKLLERVLAEEEAGSYKSLQASYYLGKVRLAQHDVPAARTLLEQVVDGQGAHSDDAEHILNALDG